MSTSKTRVKKNIIMPRVKSTHKAPLALGEIGNTGQVHEYGSPKMRSLNPCTAKVVSCNESVKWVSPDIQLAKHDNRTSKKRAQTKSTKCKEKTKGKEKSDQSPQASLASSLNSIHIDKQHCVKSHYKKLDFVYDGSPRHTCYDSDDNKENIDPENCATPIPLKKSVKKRQLSNSRQYLSGTSSRVNRM